MRRALVASGALLLASGVLLAGAAAASPRSEALGAITVKATVSDGSSPAGFTYRISGGNCAVSGATSLTTNSHGLVTFGGLKVETSQGAPCRYSITPLPREGYVVNSGGAKLASLTAGKISAAPSTLRLTESRGVFTNPTRNPETWGETLGIRCLGGEGTGDMRAGRHPFLMNCSLPWERLAGVAFTPPGGMPVAMDAGDRPIGALTYFNQAAPRSFHNATLRIALAFRDTATGRTHRATASYSLRIDDSDDLVAIPSYCQFPEAGSLNRPFACADRVRISGGGNSSFTFAGTQVNLQARFGTMRNGACSSPTSTVFPAERSDTKFCLLVRASETFRATPASVSVSNRIEAKPPSAQASAQASAPASAEEPSAEATAEQTPSASGEPSPQNASGDQTSPTNLPAAKPTSGEMPGLGADILLYLLAGWLVIGGGAVLLTAPRRRPRRRA